MSYHININKKQNFTFAQLLSSSFIPDNIRINGRVENETFVIGYNKFYLQNESSRGVALTVSETSYEVELNVCANAADYLLAAKLALAIAQINDSTISPEFDGELSLIEFEAQYDVHWAKSYCLTGIDTLKTFLQPNKEMMLPGCIRPFYLGDYVLHKISADEPTEEQFADRFLDEIKKIQFIEQTEEGLEVPTLMNLDALEGVETVQIILPGYKLLLQKSDSVILKLDGEFVKVQYQRFIQRMLPTLTRLDEAQYILQPIAREDYMEAIRYFSSGEVQSDGLQLSEQQSSPSALQKTLAGSK